MKTIPYRCDNSRHKALLGVVRSTGTSAPRPFGNFVKHSIADRQAEARFLVRQKRGNPARGPKLLAENRQRKPPPAGRTGSSAPLRRAAN
jgi:hypothetical protein